METITYRMLLDRIYDEWQLSRADRRMLNRLGEEALTDLLSIHTALMNLFPHNPMLAAYWPTTPNRGLNGLSPIEVIREQGEDGLKQIRGFLDLDH